MLQQGGQVHNANSRNSFAAPTLAQPLRTPMCTCPIQCMFSGISSDCSIYIVQDGIKYGEDIGSCFVVSHPNVQQMQNTKPR